MKTLPVPQRIALRWELWPGFGRQELLQSLAATAVFSAALLLGCLVAQVRSLTLPMVFGVLLIFAAASGYYTQMDGSISMHDYLRRRRAYLAQQQRYLNRLEVTDHAND